MRSLTVPFILIGVLGLCGPSLARDITVRKHTAEELKAICDTVGGRFSQDTRGYGCGTDCHGTAGTACTVFCPTGERCVVQVIGARRPRHVLDALKAPERHHR